MNWSLIKEFGIEYAPLSDDRRGEKLNFPVFAEQANDGTYLIVDELGTEKSVGTRTECRTIQVDANRNIIYDSMAWGIEEGYGCTIDNGLIAILRRTKWELSFVSAQGKILKTIGLSTFSKRMPRLMSWTWKKTFLIAFVDGIGQADLVELDGQGRLLWYIPLTGSNIGFPGGIQLLPNDNLLIADEYHHVAVEIQRNGSHIRHFGEKGNAAGHANCLANPKAVRQAHDGRWLIADTRGHRVLSLGLNGDVRQVQPAASDLWSPTFANVLPNGNYLVCDAGNGRVIEFDSKGHIVWQYGHQIASRRWFSFPRSVEVTTDGQFLVADTCHNRVVEASNGGVKELASKDKADLFWPRCAKRLASGSILIADGRNSRIAEITKQGKVIRELTNLDFSKTLPLEDPHDVSLLPNDNLLIVDSSQNLVVEADWSGQVHRVIGDNGKVVLNDPHNAQPLNNGHILICDTGNSRVIRVDSNGEVVQDWGAIYSHSSCFRLNYPRYAEISQEGVLVIVDTGNNRILAADAKGNLVWELSSIPESPLPFLLQPRWVHLVNKNEIVISDHYQHRILHLKHLEASTSNYTANGRNHD